jgi:hypothetical protein
MTRLDRLARCAALVAAIALTAPHAQESTPPIDKYPGRIAAYAPEPTTEGIWDGTWAFQSVDSKMALWMRTKRSKTELRLRYESGIAPVGFETDWSGEAEYHAFEKPATFRIRPTLITPDRIEGTWFWDYQFRSMGRMEKGTFTLYRALDGRSLVFRFDTYEVVETHADKTRRSDTPPLWAFFKASKYHALWDELPF